MEPTTWLKRVGRVAIGSASECSTTVALLWAFLAGVAIAANTFGVTFLSGSSRFWTFPEGDVNQWLIGWHYFAQDPWGIPLFHTDSIQPPDGISLIYLDPTPWFACLAKLLLPAHWNPYPLWVVLAFGLQSASATMVLRQCGYRGAAHALGASVILATIHAFLVRWGMSHASLAGHFVVLLALWLYLRWRNRQTSVRETAEWIGLLCAAALTHPYLFVMCAAIGGAALIRHLSSWRALLRLSAQLATAGGVIALVLLVTGYFPFPHFAKGVDPYFGPTAMNLLAPLLPLESALLPWIRLADYDSTGVGSDAACYPGLAIMLLIGFVLVARRSAVVGAIRRHWPLALACAVLTVYAVMPQVRFGKRLLFDAHVPARIAEALGPVRITGRFFLPASYTIVLGALILGLGAFRKTTAAAVILVLAIAQFVESAPLRHALRRAYSKPHEVTLDASIWTPLIRAHERIEQYPSFQCLTWSKEYDRRAMTSRELQLLAAKSHVSINGVYAARLLKDCAPEREAMTKLPAAMREDTLYVLMDPYFGPGTAAGLPSGKCAAFHGGYVCSSRWNKASLANIRDRFESVQERLPQFPLNSSLEVRKDGEGQRFLGSGWSYPEPGHIWTDADEAEMVLPKLPTTKPLRFAMNVEAFLDGSVPSMTVDLLANGTPVERWHFEPGNNSKHTPREALIPPGVLTSSGDLRLLLKIDAPHRPARVPDDRLLGLAVTHIAVSEAQQQQQQQQHPSGAASAAHNTRRVLESLARPARR